MIEEENIHPVDRLVGRRLRLRRQQMKLSQQELAAAAGVTFQQVQKYERGMNRVSASKLWAFANALKVSEAYFFEGFSNQREIVASNDAEIHAWADTFEGQRIITAAMLLPRNLRVAFMETMERAVAHLADPPTAAEVVAITERHRA